MAEKLVDVPTSAPQKGKDELAGVKLQTLKPTEVDGAPVSLARLAICLQWSYVCLNCMAKS